MTAVPEHRHVTLDEDLFHAYQDLAYCCLDHYEGMPPAMRFYTERFEAALAASRARNDADPFHHVPAP